jgi:hypothetical protein
MKNLFEETYKELTEPFTITLIKFLKMILIAAALGCIITLISAAGGAIVCIAAALLVVREVMRYFQRREGNEKSKTVPKRRSRQWIRQ